MSKDFLLGVSPKIHFQTEKLEISVPTNLLSCLQKAALIYGVSFDDLCIEALDHWLEGFLHSLGFEAEGSLSDE